MTGTQSSLQRKVLMPEQVVYAAALFQSAEKWEHAINVCFYFFFNFLASKAHQPHLFFFILKKMNK
jgi:hypothetical protein